MAQTAWTGGGDGIDWNDPLNWSVGVPNANDATIDTGSPVINATPATDPLRVFVGSAASLTLNSGILNANNTGFNWWEGGALTLGIGEGNSGSFVMGGGTLNATGDAVVGMWGGSGTWTQTGGTVNIANQWLLAQQDNQPTPGSASATLENGTVNTGTVKVGAGWNANAQVSAQLDINSGGIVNSEGDVDVAFAGGNMSVGPGTATGILNINSGGQLNIGSTTERWMLIAHWDATSGSANVNAGSTLNLNAGTDLQVGYASSGTANLTVGGTINGSAADGAGTPVDDYDFHGASYVALNTVSSAVDILTGGVINANVWAKAGVIGGDGTINGDLTLDAGALFAFSETDTLTVSGTVSLDNTFGVDDLFGLDSSVNYGTYTLIDGAGDFSGIENLGYGNAATLGVDKLAYFQPGSLQLVVTVPEPSTFALAGMAMAGLLIFRRRS